MTSIMTEEATRLSMTAKLAASCVVWTKNICTVSVCCFEGRIIRVFKMKVITAMIKITTDIPLTCLFICFRTYPPGAAELFETSELLSSHSLLQTT